MKDAIDYLVNSAEDVKIYIPGMGYRICKVLSLDDDVVEVQLQFTNAQQIIKMHYSLFVVETG
jgi:hypothetical protein